jgi:Protein of unknown function (DUF995)
MMRTFTALTMIIGFASSTAAIAADEVKLPATAKLLTKAEILEAYGGKTYSWSHPNTDKYTGTVKFDLAHSYMSGNYELGKDEWEGKVSFKGDQYCFRTRGKGQKKYNPVSCNLVYLDGTTTYELDPKTKAVKSIDKPM